MNRQKTTINVDVLDYKNWCLRYVRRFLGVKAKYDYSTKAWDNARMRHENIEFPKNVAVPVFFSLYMTIDGIYRDWGHVVIHYEGIFYSSPRIAGKLDKELFKSFGDLMAAYPNCIYLGWTEDINDVVVVELEKNVIEPFRFTETVNVRISPIADLSSNLRIGNIKYSPGEVLYHPIELITSGGYEWIKYRSNSGIESYVAIRDITNGIDYGYFIKTSNLDLEIGKKVLVNAQVSAKGEKLSSSYFTKGRIFTIAKIGHPSMPNAILLMEPNTWVDKLFVKPI